MEKSFDVIVAGGGVSGVLTAASLALEHPGLRIALVEKDQHLGGRSRSTSPGDHIYSYGLNGISDELFNFLDQLMKQDPEAPDLAELLPRRQASVGVLAGNKINLGEISQWATPKGARLLGGYSASRQWGDVEAIFRQGAVAGGAEDADDEESGDDAEQEAGAATAAAGAKKAAASVHPVSHYWSGSRKAPAAVVLDFYSSAWGIPDVWGALPAATAQRAAYYAGALHCGAIDQVLERLVNLPALQGRIEILRGCHIANAERGEDQWVLTVEGGVLRSRRLVVAQPPWVAIGWLPRKYWPVHILAVANKTKPVSVVVLSEKVLLPDVVVPDVIIVPSEKVQIIRTGDQEMTFQATIDFELSMQAPAVLKAVKALKRARRKLLTVHPGLVTELDHIALQPYAWPQSPMHADRRFVDALGRKPIATADLAFCGDAYGPSYDSDSNVLYSVHSACKVVGQSIS